MCLLLHVGFAVLFPSIREASLINRYLVFIPSGAFSLHDATKTRYIYKFVGNTALMSMSMLGNPKVTAANADSKKAK